MLTLQWMHKEQLGVQYLAEQHYRALQTRVAGNRTIDLLTVDNPLCLLCLNAVINFTLAIENKIIIVMMMMVWVKFKCKVQ